MVVLKYTYIFYSSISTLCLHLETLVIFAACMRFSNLYMYDKMWYTDVD